MIAINKFIDKIKVAESKHDRKFIMPIQDAKDLHTDITKLLLAIHQMTKDSNEEIIEIELSNNNW